VSALTKGSPENLGLPPIHAGEIAPRLAPIAGGDIAEVRTYIEGLAGLSDKALRVYATQVLGRIVHPNWSVEWNLPRWLGSRLAIPEDAQRDLVLVSSLGLGYVRLRDDRMDSEVLRGRTQISQRLESIFLMEARSLLEGLFDRQSDFWAHFHNYLHRWESAILPDAKSAPLQSSELDELAAVGAPLYIVCAAAHALNPHVMPLKTLLQPVRGYLAAAVLYDHMKDWSSDLIAGRKNIFIQTMTGEDPEGVEVDGLAARVRTEFIDQENIWQYCEQIWESLDQAAVSAQAIGLSQFAQHLVALEGEARSSAERTLRAVRKYVESAVFFSSI
jgi:hypothetical protein